ncbi:MAG: imidazole glycerol phosphate synthase subunit HisH [Saprospiraceae bacterium]
MKIVIIKYNAGNIQSVLNALERIGYKAELTDDPKEIKSADRVVFPGVGEASTAMNYLKERKLDLVIKSLEQPVLGICLGMQLLGVHSEENDTPCLNIIPASIKKISNKLAENERLKVPHIGWNTVAHSGLGLFKKIEPDSYFYFVHSYAMELCNNTIARTEYGQLFSSGAQWKNFFGVQFHPEKSAGVGEQLLKNFIEFKL